MTGGETRLRQLCRLHTDLDNDDIACLEKLADTMQYTADLTGTDIFIDCMDHRSNTAVVVAHARPSRALSVYDSTVLGQAALPENEPAVYHALRTGMVVRDLKAVTQENKAVRQDVAPIQGGDGAIIGVLIREKDVSHTLRNEEKYRELARERESITDRALGLAVQHNSDSHAVALQEVHHRVKNNLQMVASILSIQARNSPDPQIKRIFAENKSRVLSIAAIHDILTTSDSFDRVALKPLFDKLRRNLQSMTAQGQELTITIAGDDLTVSSDKAVSIAMVVNELLTNAIQHAFEGRSHGTITVTVLRGLQNSTITVEDDGNGFRADADRDASLGLQIISLTLRDKLGGKLQVQSGEQGTRAMFDFC